MFFSIIIPLFNRPDELEECLESISKQEYKDFEVILVDGSPDEILKPVIASYSNLYAEIDNLNHNQHSAFNIKHIHIPYYGISESRNLGCEQARGDYFIFIDSDCTLTPDYLVKVAQQLQLTGLDAFGGPDAADVNFSPLQKAINYSMTSFFTTGGIRGREKHIGRFYPRGFNMGFSRKVFELTKGYDTSMTVSEDIDLSIRMYEAGFKVGLINSAFVYHKRRTNFTKFFRQIRRFGAGRVFLFNKYRKELKPAHLIPFVFLCFLAILPILAFFYFSLFIISLLLLLLYFCLILGDSSIKNKNFRVAFFSVIAVILQLTAYGSGFFIYFIKIIILKQHISKV
ncbi:MAG: glycosyltransferase [Bacteroidales bacterium]|nr:glycosyltransferase [Bacteroidales bacterium]